MSELEANVEGLDEVNAEIERLARQLAINSHPFTRAMRRVTLIVTRSAKINAPVKTGRLRSSITPEVRIAGPKLVGIVGTVVKYAPKIEQPGPVRRTGRRPYLEPAITENRDAIVGELRNVVTRIIEY